MRGMKRKRGLMAIFMSLILMVTAVGFMVNGITVQAMDPNAKATFTITTTIADGVTAPQHYNIAWTLYLAATNTPADNTSNPGETLQGSFNETVNASGVINFQNITESQRGDYYLKITGTAAGLTIKMNGSDITSEIEGAGKDVSLTEGGINLRYEQAPPNNNPGQDSGQDQGPAQQYSNAAKIEYIAHPGEWSVKPMVREQYNAEGDVAQDDPNHVSYERYAYTAGVMINGGQRNNVLDRYTYDADISGLNNQKIGYNRENSDNTVDITFFTSWGNMFEGNVTINGIVYPVNNYIDFSDRNSYLNHVSGQEVNFTITDVPVSNNIDAEGAEIYQIDIQVRPIEEEECVVGNFLWSNDPRMDPEVTGVEDDMYIGHSELTLLSVTYDDGTGEQTKSIDALKNPDGSSVYPYLQIDSGTNNETGAEFGSMFIPEGSWVTMKIEPEYGYQVKSFSLNGDQVNTGDDMSVFSFQIGKGNFHIGAKVEPVEDETRVTATDSNIEAATVELADGTLDRGSARMYLENAEVSSDKKSDFDEFATSTGTEIDSYVDIHMDQVFYKGTGNDDDVWSNEMNDLSQAATIKLKLDGYDGEDVVLLHNIHNGDDYEEIPLTYNAVDGTYEGEVTSFSNFAIAKKMAAPGNTSSTSVATKTTSPKTFDPLNSVFWMIMMGLGVVLFIYGWSEIKLERK
ncbi:MAG: hypothetical protein K6B67_03970 [Lachnospiraceae bacterium]|nr:hypothetical protein [Lachnospiraceae bacterium]